MKKTDEIIIGGQCDLSYILYACTKRDIIEPKEEYKRQIEEINESNKLIKEKFNKLVKQLEELGCYCDDLLPTYKKIPNDWYHIHEYIDISNCYIGIYYHQNTKFYEFIKSAGLILCVT